ncbi:MAG TPA: AAA domain-containing protein [Candidatus Xenobia bacterium]|jgi:hypothetical protein
MADKSSRLQAHQEATLQPPAGQKFLASMLERLYAALSSGPTLNCRPANSRQRIDLTDLRLLQDLPPDAILAALLGAAPTCTIHAKAVVPPPLPEAPPDPESPPGRPRKSKASVEEDPATKAIRDAWDQQSKVLRKLRAIAEDTRTYEQDTGTNALYIGWPLLSLPPGGDRTSRILAPIAFIPLDMTVQTGRRPSVELAARDERLIVNPALAAWLERQTGRSLTEDPEDNATPWEYLRRLLVEVNSLLRLDGQPLSQEDPLVPAPRSEALTQPEVLSTAVLGLFPLANQSILADVRDMAAGSIPPGPVESFLRADLSINPNSAPSETPLHGLKKAHADRCVMLADPCQSRAVEVARTSRGLVIHGPPGTGKSQTIANIIADHLARGQRVLMVCDKRTALDVVYQRLDHMGLGHLCAIVHDAQADRRKLYLSIRDQLEALPDQAENPAFELTLQKIDAELQALHEEYRSYLNLLAQRPAPDAQSFSELAGEWLHSRGTGVFHVLLREEAFTTPRRHLDGHQADVQDALARGLKINYATNAWRDATDMSLSDYLRLSTPQLRLQLETCHRTATAADACAKPGGLPFTQDPKAEANARQVLSKALRTAHDNGAIHRIERWVRKSPQVWKQALQAIQESADFRTGADAVHDRELELASKTAELLTVNQDLESLRAYGMSLSKWYGFLQFGVRKRGQEVLRRYVLGANPVGDVVRLNAFLQMRRSQVMLSDLCTRGLDEPQIPPSDALQAVAQHEAVLRLLVHIDEEPLLHGVRSTLLERIQSRRLADDLELSTPWAETVARFEEALKTTPACSPVFREGLQSRARTGDPVGEPWSGLLKDVEHLEDVIRIRQLQAGLPADIGVALHLRLLEGFKPEEGWQTLVHRVCHAELHARLAAEPRLASIDADRLDVCQRRYLELTLSKHGVVQEHVRQGWLKRQRQRLLASTGGRLNGAGAELKRRLYVRGANALRLRQVVAAGAQASDGDPLFDLRPVWMASPGTVAQIFPRTPVFDVVVFDEASQCRLEEAIPVMTRAHRVVIAGDPKQLPPTRFFESAVVDTGESDAETEQELFEAQQSEIEDILAAALNLEIDQAYLDVHYRSSNEALIGFSNDSFYSSRLQSIPGHPRNLQMVPPIRLVQADGIYEKRTNKKEAEEVVRIVRELLRRAEPPSIGIACFNLTQRDTIVEALDAAAMADGEFAARLAEARHRTGRDAFQGLFVKNLESVQGDERNVMIISTTFGPDPTGKFYRRFGPLGLAGGARRMNVLVTRARDEVIVVTSIPPTVYRNVAPPPEGRTPNGAWYLFAYLRYAERLVEQFEQMWERRKAAAPSAGRVKRYDSKCPSAFVEALAQTLSDREKHASEVYWGGDGFCVDLALQHPERAGDVSLGVLCDGTRYLKAPDPAEWDAFRTVVLQSQGWALHRVWTPHFVRNPERCLQALQSAVSAELSKEREGSARPAE